MVAANPDNPRSDSSPQDAGGKAVVGWREYVALPDWGIDRVKVKVDTGARTSAIHVAEFDELADGTARFEVVVSETPTLRTILVEAPLVREAVVKPSSGKRQRRPVVKTMMRLGGVEKEIEITLVSRKGMLCRMLLGRTALEGDFVVDPSRKYLLSQLQQKRKKRKEKRRTDPSSSHES